MNKIAYKLIYNRKKQLNRQGMALVQVEAYQHKRKIYFSTGIYLKPEQWDVKRQAVKNHPNSKALNWWLREYVAQIEKQELECWQQGKQVSLEVIKDLVRKENGRQSFLTFYEKEATEANLKESSRRNHRTTLMLLRMFKHEIYFSELTFEFICSFEHFLFQKGYHTNTVAKHMKHLKRYINSAINKNYMREQQYAFRKYKIKTVENKHTHLTPGELQRLEQWRNSAAGVRYKKTLDAFLFCCYAGLRYSDFIRLTPNNLVTIHRETWLIYQSVKTGVEIRLPLYLLFKGKAVDMLKEYRKSLSSFFSLKDNSNVNKELRTIARLAGIAKPLSFHVARHTNATLLIYNGVNITTVQKLLGHKSVKTTQIYASIMDRTIVQDLKQHSSKL